MDSGIVQLRLISPLRSINSRDVRRVIEREIVPSIVVCGGASSRVMNPGRLISVTLPVVLSQEIPSHLQQLEPTHLAIRPEASD